MVLNKRVVLGFLALFLIGTARTQGQGSLPTGWSDQDVGTTGVAGSASYTSGVFTVSGAGSEIYGTADGFNFAYQALSGDGTIVARIVTSQSVSSYSAAGVMIRETLDAGSTNAKVAYWPVWGQIYFDARTSTGGTTSEPGALTATVPYWVEVVRSGSTFTGYTSPDGINWSQLGSSETISMAQTVYVGLAVTSASTSSLATATFDNVSVGTPTNPAPAITSISPSSGLIGSQTTISGSGFGASQGSSQVLLNDVPLTINSWSDTSVTVTIPSNATTPGALTLVVSVAPSMNDSNPASFTVLEPLPTDWLDQDIGSVGKAGTATYLSGVFTVNGSGTGISGTSDEMNFAYQPLSGDGSIIARVVTVTGYGQPVVMIRESLNANSTDAYLLPEYSYIFFFDRPTTGASVSNPGYLNHGLPYWIEVVRSGNSFSTYTAPDGVTWTQLGSTQTITMAQNVYIGFGVSSQNNSTLATAAFDNVSISTPASPAPAITGVSATTGSVGDAVLIVGSNFGASQGSSLVTLNGAPLSVTSWSDTSIAVTIPSGATSGPLLVSVGPSMNDSNSVYFTVTSQPLAIGWLDQNIGASGGSATYSGETFTVVGANGNIGGSADGFHFVYQSLPGDGTIVGHVANIQGNYPQVGLMIRETLTPGSTDAFIMYTPNQGQFYYRSTTAASISEQTNTFYSSAYPYWVMLTRSGSTFTASLSSDGVYWTQIGSTTITMAQNVYIGMAVSTNLVTATFDYVSLSSPTSAAPVITGLSATTASIGQQVVITGSGFGANQGGSAAILSDAPMTINSWSDTSITATIPSGAVSGYIAVSVAPGMNDSNAVYLTVTTQPLTRGWLDQNIGASGGSATYSNSTFTVIGADGNISSTADGFHFVYQPLAGDGTIVARVANLQGGSYPQAGVMIRETLTPDSTTAFLMYNPNQGQFYYRSTTGAAMSEQTNTFYSSAYPYWVMLTRSGNVFTGFMSSDGETWQQIGTATISMATNVYIGMAVSSTYVTATFDCVSLGTPSTPAPSITGLSATTGSIGSQIVITGSGFGATQGGSAAILSDAPMTINSWSNTSITATIPSGAVSGYFAVSVAPSMNDSNVMSFTVTTQPLPTGWLDQDIGASGGSATYSGGTFTVIGANGNVGSTADGFHFVYQSLSGDGTIVARVANVQGTSFPQAGVMIRETLTSGSNDAFIMYNPNQGQFYYRTTTSAAASEQTATFYDSVYPYWVRLTRSGTTFTAYLSLDGVYWTQVGTQTISMATNVYIGMAVSSSYVTAAFDNVSLGSGTPYPVPTVSAVSPTSAAVGYTITISGSAFGTSQGTSVVYFNGVQAAAIASWSDTQIVATVPSGASTGPVTVVENGVGSNTDVALNIYNPVIASVTPPAAPVGGQVIVTGTGLSTQWLNFAGQVVMFNGVAASPYVWSATSLTVNVPQGATTGPLTVVVNGVPSSAMTFTVVDPASISSVSPGSGPIGSSVTVTGDGFGPTQSDSVLTFDGAPAASIVSWSNTQIVAIVPSGASTGPVTVTVANATANGPSFQITSSIQLSDSFGNQSTYATVVVGGQWAVSSAQGSGCSSCTLRGNVTTQYDGFGNVASTTDELGNVTSYAYDPNNNLASVTRPAVSGGTPTTTYTYNNFGEELTATDPLGHVITNTYDSHGNLTSVTSPAPGGGGSASVTQFAYNSLGELTQITDPLGHATNVSYNSVGLISSITDPQSNVTAYTYDSRGNRTNITDALSHVTSFTYDSGNRITQITYPDSTTTSFTYDYRGRRTSVTDQNGKTTSYAYDVADRLTSVTDAASHVTGYGYDTENNLTSITDANSHTTNFAYDAFGRVTETTFPSNLSETYTYDADSNPTSKTDRKGQTIQYVYDALNRLTQKTYPDSTTVEYTYDLVGKVTQVNDPTGTYGFSYDNMGRLTGTSTQYAFLAGTFTNSYTYDAASNRTGFTAPDSSTDTYSYDTLNRLTTLANSWAGSFGFSYDALSRRTQMTRPNNVATNYNYDNLSHLLSILHQLSGSTIDGASYTLDSAGNRTAKTDDYASVTSNYSYDSIYELTQVTKGGSTTESYSYDAVGNRTASLGVSSYTNNSSNEVTGTSSAGYTYDYNGNTTSKTASGGTTDYSWDYENRLSSVTLPSSGGTVTFKYDPFGRRIEKVSPSATSIFIHDGNNLVETVNASGTEVAHYTQGQNIDEPLAMQRGTTTDFYEADGLGSVTSLTATNGSIASTYTYDSFGNTTNSTGSVTNYFRYSAREFDTETSLYYDRARNFDPAAGKFNSEDPLGFQGRDIDLYRYVWNSSPNLKDPTGLLGVGYSLNAGGYLGASPLAGGGSASIGGLYFPNPKNNGGYLSYGGFAGSHGLCGNYQNNQTGGLSGGTGLGVVFTSANSISDVSGPFNTTQYSILYINFEFSYSPDTGTWVLNVSNGYGLGFSQYVTNTVTNPVSPPGPGCQCGK
jgi:RHS repeat-associated protein